MSAELSEYEQLRERNIARNRAVMQALGLFDNDIALHKANAGAATTKTKAPKKRKAPAEPREGARRSKRVQGQTPDGDAMPEPTATAPRCDDQVDGLHAKARDEHNARWAGHQQRATIVGTASYAHTLMRVRTMSEDALWRRMKTIEKAKGQHAVTKMRLFARVCFLEELFELADACSEALKRLIDVLGDPNDDETTDAPPVPDQVLDQGPDLPGDDPDAP